MIMESDQREMLIAEAMNNPKKGILPLSPSFKDLKRFSKIRLKKRRSQKKFRKQWYRYVSEAILNEYFSKVMTAPLRIPLNYSELGRKLLMVEELPQGAYAKCKKENDYGILES